MTHSGHARVDTPSKLHTCFLKTYDALQHILGDVEVLGERRSFLTAAKRFGEFRLLLEQHLKDEDDVLLPCFVHAAPEQRGTLEGIHAHRSRLLSCVEGVASAITGADSTAFGLAMNDLDQALDAHHLEEEHVVHPALDGLLKNDADWEHLCTRARFAHAEAVDTRLVHPVQHAGAPSPGEPDEEEEAHRDEVAAAAP